MEAIWISGPYRGNGDTNSIYEVQHVQDAPYGGHYVVTLAVCRKPSTALARAKKERTERMMNVPIYKRFPGQTPELLES